MELAVVFKKCLFASMLQLFCSPQLSQSLRSGVERRVEERRVEAHGKNCFLDSAGPYTSLGKTRGYIYFPMGVLARNSGTLQ
jgi:hypothetical protein